MRTLIPIIITLVLHLSTAHSQDAVFRTELSRDTILLGNVIELRYTIENIQGDYKAPRFDGFTMVSGPNVSSQFSMINGKVTQSSSYSYFLRPEETGVYTIDGAQLENGENVWHTDPVTIVVLPNPQGIIENPRGFGFRQQFMMKDTMSRQDSILQKLKKVKTYKI